VSLTRLLTFCFRNLLRRKVRTSLCVLGVVIAATFIVAIGATTMRYTTVIRELNVLFNGQVTVVSKDAIVIQALPIGGSMLPQDPTVEKILTIPGVRTVTPALFLTSVSSQAIIQAVPVNFTMGLPVEDWSSILGPVSLRKNGHLPANDSSNEIWTGGSLADQYGWSVGTEIRVNNYTLHVSGVFDTSMALLNRCLIMPLTLAQTVYNDPQMVNIIAVRPAGNTTEQDLTLAIKQKISYVNALTETQRNDIVQPVLDQVQTWTLGIEAVVFIISLILVMTVTVMSVSERRRDFATLDAIGAPTGYVFRVVILETFLIGVLGGAVGIASGSLTALVLASIYTNIPLALFFPSILDIVPPLYMLEMFVAIVGVCCLGGIVPAINAMRMRIAEVLRAEY
jgi:putative ABC transport system permease protein